MNEIREEIENEEWYNKVSLNALDDDVRFNILNSIKDKIGFNETCKALNIAKSSMHRYLSKQRKVPDEVVEKALKLLNKEEFDNIVGEWDKLKALNIVKGDSINYSLALKILALASRDEYLRNALLTYVVKEYKEELRKMLGISLSNVKMEWDKDFETFLSERKRRKKVKTEETLNYYKSLFNKYLRGKELNEKLVDYVTNHESKWLRNVFRHYIQYLYLKRKVSPETFGWIMEAVPSRSYNLSVRPYQIKIEDVKSTLDFLREKHEVYYVIYRLMLESGIRRDHALKLIETWNPEEEVEIDEFVTKRLLKLSSFSRYYLGLREGNKPCDWVYLSNNTLKLIENISPRHISKDQVTRYAKRNNLILPKYMRKVSWRLLIEAMPREVARFIQSRFGELKISEARYEDLLSEADKYYTRYLELLKNKVEN